MKPGPFLYEEDQITDMPLRLMAAEITREKIFEQLYRELLHAALVETESWETFDNGDIKISQAVIVQRDSQKAIKLGKGGSRIKQIGAASRLELEKLAGDARSPEAFRQGRTELDGMPGPLAPARVMTGSRVLTP
ncbi:MAG: KH domain-containing protein [Alphaproteobacteria bacterium]